MCVKCGINSCGCNGKTILGGGGVTSIVAGTNVTVDNADPINPIINAIGGGQVNSVVAGTNVTVDNADPINPIISASGGVTSIVAGTNVTISPVGGTGAVTISSSGGGGGFTHYLGEEFEGGIIYDLYKDSGGVEHGLIVSKTEQVTTTWQAVGTLTGADRSEDGVFNTNLMTLSDAATYVTSLGAGWYLPSIDELNLLYYNRYYAQKALRAGAFTLLSDTANYWSSTEDIATAANSFYFKNGYGTPSLKSIALSVRAIRSF